MRRTVLVCLVTALLLGGTVVEALSQETRPIGKTKADQERNAALLGGYDYSKYPTALTGFTGQDLQRVGFISYQRAIRTRVGERGNYKAGMAQLSNGRLIIGVCRQSPGEKAFRIHVYESADRGLTWKEIGKSEIYGKEPAMAALPNGDLVMTAQGGFAIPNGKAEELPVYISKDGGRNWDTTFLPGNDDYPRSLIVEHDGSLLMIRAWKSDWSNSGKGSPNLQLARSKDGGRTWDISEGIVGWDYPAFGEVATVRLTGGKLLAALRIQIPKTEGEGFETTVITESTDNGKHWSKPRQMVADAEVHVYLTELKDGRVLATYSSYHLPWGSFAVISKDKGKTFDLDHPIQLSLSQDIYVGWAVTLQLPGGDLLTSYASTTDMKSDTGKTTCETVRWSLPRVVNSRK